MSPQKRPQLLAIQLVYTHQSDPLNHYLTLHDKVLPYLGRLLHDYTLNASHFTAQDSKCCNKFEFKGSRAMKYFIVLSNRL
ncbi:hypothetical protein [Vibrio gallaecicus]|uniref:hypothetical protein n=1 Tax=Vibrio gallaecicus TaxID=552386 RepID=UPI0025B295DF|nr:hypothetical protein [Vibrio gallaecicus]MDN3613044.1 hypothetical protein [Vibrio gallaecicus]